MSNELSFVVINTILYVFLFLVSFFIFKRAKLAQYVTGIWGWSSVTTIFYYIFMYRNYVQINPITLFPFIYLFVLIFIWFYPLFRIDNKKVKGICGNRKILRILAILIVLINIPPFYENIMYALAHIGAQSDQFADNYEDKAEYLSAISQILAKYSSYLRIITPVLLFYFLQSFNRNKFISIGLIMSVFNPMLTSLNNGSRFVLVTDLLFVIGLYILLNHALAKRVKFFIFKYSMIVLPIVAVIFIVITLVRFSDHNGYSVWNWLSLYTGESYLNFNADMWNLKKFTNGDNSFFLFRHWLGDYPTVFRDPDYLGGKVPIRMYVFYTFIGDFFVDFGAYITVLISIVSAFIFYRIAGKLKGYIPIYLVLIFAVYLKILVVGFTYYTYLNVQISLVYTLLIAFILYIFEVDF